MRKHGSLEKDEETNQAAWEAARGAVKGATKVCLGTCFFGIRFFLVNSRECCILADLLLREVSGARSSSSRVV